MSFDGTRVNVNNQNTSELKLILANGDVEVYKPGSPSIVIGNLLMPSRTYIEANGELNIYCPGTGARSEIKFLNRAWTSDFYTNRVEATVFDPNGKESYKLEGYYTGEIHSTNVATGEKELVFKAPI